MPASYNPDQAKGKNASGPITKKRFVKLDATAADGESVLQCNTAGELAFGVSLFSVSASEILRGKGVSVITDGRVILEQDGSLTALAGQLVSTDNIGRARLAQTGDYVMGLVDENGGGAAGTEVGVKLESYGKA